MNIEILKVVLRIPKDTSVCVCVWKQHPDHLFCPVDSTQHVYMSSLIYAASRLRPCGYLFLIPVSLPPWTFYQDVRATPFFVPKVIGMFYVSKCRIKSHEHCLGLTFLKSTSFHENHFSCDVMVKQQHPSQVLRSLLLSLRDVFIQSCGNHLPRALYERQVWWHMLWILAFRMKRQAGTCEFKITQTS